MCVRVVDAFLGAEEFQGRQGEWEKIMKGENNKKFVVLHLWNWYSHSTDMETEA